MFTNVTFLKQYIYDLFFKNSNPFGTRSCEFHLSLELEMKATVWKHLVTWIWFGRDLLCLSIIWLNICIQNNFPFHHGNLYNLTKKITANSNFNRMSLYLAMQVFYGDPTLKAKIFVLWERKKKDLYVWESWAMCLNSVSEFLTWGTSFH